MVNNDASVMYLVNSYCLAVKCLRLYCDVHLPLPVAFRAYNVKHAIHTDASL